ncbi:MAG: rod shape-determining protein MreC [Anaerolineae bacterium]
MRKRDLLPVALLLVAVVLLLVDRSSRLPSPKSWLSRTASSVQMGVNRAVRNLSNAGVFFENLEDLRAENEALAARLEELTVQSAALQEVIAENEVLRRELGFVRSEGIWGLRGAEVRGRVAAQEPGSLIHSVIIDVGSDTGLLPDMPVVTGRGLVGRVTAVEDGYSDVMLVTDSRSAVAAVVQRTRAAGLVKGQIDGTLIMENISRDADVQVGDIVLTSGLGGVFPRGIVIGQVSEVIRTDTAMFQQAVITPSADLANLEVVLVVTEPQTDIPEVVGAQ